MAKPTEAQLAKINRFAKVPLSADDVYVHGFKLIGTKYMKSRKLQIDRSLLDRYAPYVENGDVGLIANHSFGEEENITLPFGRSFEYEIVQNGDSYRLDGNMYMKAREKTYVYDFTTDDISSQIDAGILHDNSVSITWGLSECSICHNDIRDFENCKHWPGRSYDVNGQNVECYVIAKPKPENDNSMMIENSIVVAGAYPDAGVLSLEKPPREPLGKTEKLKLNNIADLKLVAKDAPVFCCLSSTSATFQIEGENLRDASELHQLYHSMYSETELPEGWTMAKLTAKHKEAVKELLDAGHEHLMQDALDGTLNDALKAKSTKGSESQMAMTDEEKKLYDDALSENAQFKADLKAAEVDSITALTAKIEELSTTVDKLTPQAELGAKYREDVIEDAIKAGVRDQGNDFDEDTYREMFAALDIDKVKTFAEKWEASALAKLGIPKAHTQGEKLELPDGAASQKIDVSLYRVGR